MSQETIDVVAVQIAAPPAEPDRAGSFTLDKAQMQTVAIGACVLASGGGGSYQVSVKIIEQGVAEGQTVTAVPLGAVGAGEWAAVSANMGSPTALFQTTNPYAPRNAFVALETMCAGLAASGDGAFAGFGRFDYTLPVEVGAINSASPLTVAAQLGLPIVDADGAGRSIPTLPLTTFARRVPVYPNVLASNAAPGQHYNTGTVNVRTETEAEDAIIGLVMTPPFGGIAGLAIYPQTGATLAEYPMVAGTLYDALRVGECIQANTGIERAQAVVRYLTTERPAGPRDARIVFQGRVVAMAEAAGGTQIGSITLADASGTQLWIYNENENIFAMRSDAGAPLLMGPDSICYVPATGTVFDNSDLWMLYQQDPASIPEIFVVAIDAPQVVKENAGLMHAWQPERARFGYAGPYAQPWRF